MGEDRLKTFGDLKVSEIMIKNPLYTTLDEKISKTELLMLRKNINGLPVVDNNMKVIGIITQRDIRLARFAISLESSKTIVKNLMTPEPFVVKQNDTIKKTLEIMFENNIERLPVVKDNSNELIGLVLEKIILKKLLEYLK
ncbi:MAG: CBS domain-containing protein [Promethearchaeota archaeon]